MRRRILLVVLVSCSDPDTSSSGRHDISPQPSGSADAATPPPPPAPPPQPHDAAPSDPCAGRRVCDSFENGLGAPFTVHPNAGKVEVSTTRAFTGTHSVKATTSQAQYQSALFDVKGAPLFPLPSNELYGRMMVWLENPAADGVHWTMARGAGPVPGKSGVSASMSYGGQLGGKLIANYDTSGASTDCWQHSATPMPIGKWVCVSWRLAGATNEMQLWMDGKEVTDLHVKNQGQGCLGNDLDGQWLAPTFESASIGWESYQQDVGHTMYIDDVILDASPIACP